MLKNLLLSKKIIAILFLLLVPTFYVYFYVSSYYDTLNTTQDFKIGVVMLDKKQKNQNYGAVLQNNLKENKAIKWVFYNNEQSAKNDINKYDNTYLYIKIPADFTKKIISIKSNLASEKLSFDIVQNPKKNGYVSTLAQTLKQKIKDNLASVLYKTAIQLLLNKTPKIKNKISQVNMGINKLNNGFTKLNTSLLTLNTSLVTKINQFNVLRSDFYNSFAYQTLPNINNDINLANSYANSLFDFNQEVDSSISKQVVYFINTLPLNHGVKNQIMQEIGKLNNIHHEIIILKQNTTSLVRDDRLKYHIQKINYLLQSSKLLDLLDNLHQNSILLTPKQKTEFSIINNYLRHVKVILLDSFDTSLKIVNLTQNKLNQIKNYVPINPFNKLLNELNYNPSVINEVLSLTNNERIMDMEQKLLQDTKNLQSDASKNLQLGQETKTIIKKLFSDIDINFVENNPKQVVNNFLSPVSVEIEDLNHKQVFGTIFFPLTLAIGLWFVLTFYFASAIKKGDYKENFYTKYFFHLTIIMILGSLTAFIMLIIANYFQIKISNSNSFILTILLYLFALYNLFTLVYYLIFNYAKYILTIILIVNITCSGATYSIQTLNNNFTYFNKLTHFRYFINILRELFSTWPNYEQINYNQITLLIFGSICLLVTLLLNFSILLNNKYRKEK